MSKLQMLFIRACKVQEPTKRLRSLYRRFFIRNIQDDIVTIILFNKLLEIVDKYFPVPSIDLVNSIRLTNKSDDNILQIVINIIRYKSTEAMPKDFIKPSRFK